MNRLASMRVGAVVVALAMALAGCDCGKVDCTRTPTDPKCICDNSDLTVAFVAPEEGAMVDQTSNVQVSLARKGTPVNIGTARLEVRGPGATDFSDKGNGTADGATATFTGVMLAAGENALRATVAEANCSGNANPKTIVVTAKSMVTPPPVIVSCTFPQDSNGDGTLNAAELPAGAQVSVRVLTTNGAGATFSAPGSNPAMAPIMNETATIAVPGPAADGTFSVTGTVTRGTGMPTCSPMIRVQRTAGCAVENTTSQAPRGPMDDADAAAAGFQVRASATRVTGMAATATLRMGNETRTINLNSMASASADFTVASMGTQNYMVTLEASDSAGNPCMVTNATRTIPVDFDAPMFTILTPTATADGGRPTVTASQVSVGVSVLGGNNGATACVFRVQGTMRVQADCETVVNDAASLVVPLSADGTYTLEVQLTDLAGNMATRSVEIDVVLSGCGLSFTRPSLCPALITSSQVSTGNYTFQTQSKAVCAGQPARLFRSIVGADGGVGAPVQVSSGQLAGTGQSSLTANVTSGDYVFRAEVDNLADGGIEIATCDVTIDLDGPDITSPVLSSGLTRFSINASQDSDPGLAGAQRALSFSARVPQNGRVDVCTTQAVDPVSMQARQTTPECGAGWFLLQGSVSSPLGGFTFPSGSYSIKVVVVGGGTTVASAELPLLVDVVRPCLSLNSIRFPQDVNSDARLNSMELASAAARLDFQLDPACGDANLASLATMNPVLVREITAGMPGAVLNAQSDVSFAAGRVVVNLTQGVANERDYSFYVELTDAAGNRSLFSGVMDRAVASVRIDRVAPSCTVVSPTRTTLNRADLQAATNLNAVIGTSADVGTMGVTSTLLGPQSITRSGGPMGPANEAGLTFAGLSGTNTWTLSATCSDASGNSTSIAPRTLTIDLDAPTCAITSPTPGTYADLNLSTSVAVSGADSQMVTISATPGGTRGTLTVISGVATGSILYSLGSQDITATVSDAAGNACVTAPVTATINTSDCVLAITNAISNPSGLWFSRSNTGMLVGTGVSTAGTATISAQTSNCTAGRTLTLQRTSPAGTPITTTDVAGVATFPNVTLTNLDTWTVSVPNGARPATVVTFRVDLDAPAFGVGPGQVGFVRLNGTLVAPATPTFFVASADNRNVDTGTTGYFADLGGAAGSQTNLVIDNTDAFHFGLGGDVRVTFKGTTIATQSVTSSGQTISFTGPSALQLPQNDSGPLVVRVSDSAGNFNEWTSTATIDVESPSAPPGFSQSITNSRRGEVSVAWDPSFDDSVVGSGPCEYEVGWTTSSVPGNGGLATNALYFANTTNREARVAHSASRLTRLYLLPPINTYFLKVRAVDEVGNYSAFGGGAPTALPNPWTEITLTNPSTDTTAAQHNFGLNVAAGTSLNNDAIPDLVVAAPNRGPTGFTNRGSVFVYYGAANFAAPTGCTAPACQEIQPPTDPTASGLFGTDVSTSGNVGDLGAENKADLIVAQPTWQTNVGRAFLFFGRNAPQIDAANFIEFRGSAGSNFASAARLIKDIDGDGLDEVVITAHSEALNAGRIYVFRGRSADPTFMAGTPGANWFNTRVDIGGGVLVVPTSAATWTLAGPNPIVASNNEFGRLRFGLVSLGALQSGLPVRNSFLIPMSRESVNRVAIYFAPELTPLSGTVTFETPNLLQDVRTPSPSGSSTSNSGFGRSAVGGLNIAGGIGLDLAVSYPLQNRVHLYYELGASGVVGCTSGTTCNPSLTISGQSASLFGTQVSAGDMNADSAVDLVVGEAPNTAAMPAPVPPLPSARSWVLWQRSGSFDTNINAVAPNFWVSEITVQMSSRLGRVNAIAEIDGANGPDLILGDETAGQVRIWR